MKKGSFVAAKSIEFPGESKCEPLRKPKPLAPPRVVRKPAIFNSHPILQKLLSQPKPEPSDMWARMTREPTVIEPSRFVDLPSPPEEEDHSLDKYRKKFQIPEVATPPKKPRKIAKANTTVENLTPWEVPRKLEISRPTKQAKIKLHPQLKRVVHAFCLLHRLPPPKNFADLRPYLSKPLESSTGLNVFSNWIWLSPDSRHGRKPPFSIWLRGTRIYDLDADRGSIDDFINDCNKADRVCINRDEVRARRSRAGLPPFPYAPSIEASRTISANE